jgi:hypothetical protein
MNLRRSTHADIHKLARLWVDMCLETEPDIRPNGNAWKLLYLNNLTNPNYFCFVVDEGGKLTGFLCCEMTYDPSENRSVCEGIHYYVRPEYRHGPSAKLLYDNALEEAVDRGATTLQLICFDETKEMWSNRGWKVKQYIMEKAI